jgi:hypothetical protein
VLPDGTNWHASPLTLGDAIHSPDSTLLHERCYQIREQGCSREQSSQGGAPIGAG